MLLNRRLFLSLLLITPAFSDSAGPSRRRMIRYQVAWGPLYPEFKEGRYLGEDQYGLYVEDGDRKVWIRRDQVVK